MGLKLLGRRNPLIVGWADDGETAASANTEKTRRESLLKECQRVWRVGREAPTAVVKLRRGPSSAEMTLRLRELEDVQQNFALK